MYSPLIPHHGETPTPPDYIRFVVISDTHGKTSKLTVPPGDILLHCGDFCRKGGSLEQVEAFNDFLRLQPHAAKIVIAGNHDFCFDHSSFFYLKATHGLKATYMPLDPQQTLTSATYLKDSGFVLCGYKIWGSPWVPRFSKTAFSIPADSATLRERRQEIPRDTEILMTHCPPQGVLDLSRKGVAGGCLRLAERVREVHPLVHVFGHIHEGYGYLQTRRTLFINAASVTKNYRGVNAPFVVDLPRKAME
mmetsp:Transcript_25727/g.45149  ORF Transcript_25727/g.45149 Transcript_25727/m.45149 type:complete len:249 (-) Transcript_25727:36-782(-)